MEQPSAMSEKSILFPSDGLELEGNLRLVHGSGAVIVCHPHPEYGGNMDNDVVKAVTKTLGDAGLTTLRFNFGSFDNGVREQNDIIAAVLYLAELGKSEIDLVGYSFGAWVVGLALPRLKAGTAREGVAAVRAAVLISPPIGFPQCDYSTGVPDERIRLVLVGEKDQFGPPKAVLDAKKDLFPQARVCVVPGVDHFWAGGFAVLEAELRSALARP